ncbi:MAG TPA: type II toxin-antitoxin system RelE/ParE family toxin [Thermoprotei archaeon]|nr:type II toxin-antitoxin system RelE/ParE family toxin [Thermoprotei archaeon]
MESFRLEIKKTALKNIRRYKEYREKFTELFKTLKNNPIPYKNFDIVKLKGYKQTYRIRLGKIRIIYQIDWIERRIIILVVAKRSKAYKQ